MHSGHMDSHQTLHDFVLDLLTNPDARSAFDLDPEGALRAAGLTDVTAADVQEVVPLVMDYAPVHGIGTLPQVGDVSGAVTGTVGGLGDPNDAIHQLQSLAQQATVTPSAMTADFNAWAAGAMTVDPLGDGGPALLGNGSLGLEFAGTSANMSVDGDLAHTLDADLPGPDLTGGIPTDLPGPVDGLTGGTPTDGLLGGHDLLPPQLGPVDLGDPLGGVRDITGGDLPLPSVPSVPDLGSTVDGITSPLDGGLSADGHGGVSGDLNGLTGGAAGGLTSGTASVTGDAGAYAGGSDGGLLGLGDGLF